MKYQVGQVVKFNSSHHKNLQGKITEAGNVQKYGNYYVVEADGMLHPEVEVKNIWIYEKNIIELVNNNSLGPKEKFPGEFDGWIIKGFENEKI